ncbi:hypothetical protein [Neisseria sp. Ec49-e6-T10]|uniref:hypothetical protein n=1 Tax=Neisseria sp. Ec49-e6-T10 TaxID=3140744 RepID=UPI003EB8BBE2
MKLIREREPKIARAEDVQYIKNYDEVVETLQLDYDATPFIESKNSYGLIKFKVQKPDTVDIPYSKVLGGAEDIKAPCTGNGFTATRNGDVIPEWKAAYDLPQDGAELYRVVDGKEELIARYIEIEDGEGYFMKLPKKDK